MSQMSFRMWVQNLWFENSEEHLIYKENPLTMKEYWDRYKYWLKREYQHQQKVANEKRL